jgi:hypothetical protein
MALCSSSEPKTIGFGQSRHEYDRHVVEAGITLQLPAGLETVHPGHDGVEQHDVGRDLIDDPHGGCAVELAIGRAQ